MKITNSNYLRLHLVYWLTSKITNEQILVSGGVFKGSMPKEEYFSRALYTVDIGQNDLTAGFFSNKSAEEFIPDALTEFTRVIKVRKNLGTLQPKFSLQHKL